MENENSPLIPSDTHELPIEPNEATAPPQRVTKARRSGRLRAVGLRTKSGFSPANTGLTEKKLETGRGWPLPLLGGLIHHTVGEAMTTRNGNNYSGKKPYSLEGIRNYLRNDTDLEKNWLQIVDFLGVNIPEMIDPNKLFFWLSKPRFYYSKSQMNDLRQTNQRRKEGKINDEELIDFVEGKNGMTLQSGLEEMDSALSLHGLVYHPETKSLDAPVAEPDIVGLQVLNPKYGYLADLWKKIEYSRGGKFNFLNLDRVREDEISLQDGSKITYEMFFKELAEAMENDGVRLNLVEIKTAYTKFGEKVDNTVQMKKYESDIAHTLLTIVYFLSRVELFSTIDAQNEIALRQRLIQEGKIVYTDKGEHLIMDDEEYLEMFEKYRKEAIENKLRKILKNIVPTLVLAAIPNLKDSITTISAKSGSLMPSDFSIIDPHSIALIKLDYGYLADRIIKDFNIDDYLRDTAAGY